MFHIIFLLILRRRPSGRCSLFGAGNGEEVVWHNQNPIWSMNYFGRITGDNFYIEFLKEALFHVSEDMPYRGPAIYAKGDYHYHCRTEGEFIWYQGYEEIFCVDEKIYECYFHGGAIK